MADCRIIDTFPAFLDFWPVIQHEPLDAQVDAWASVHMARWPELLEKQQADGKMPVLSDADRKGQ